MFGMIFYLRLISGVGLIIGGILFIYEKRKNQNKEKNQYLPSILLIFAGILQFISALAYVFDKTGRG